MRKTSGYLSPHQTLRAIKGIVGSYIAYPLAQHFEKRQILPKLRALRKYYQLPFTQRLQICQNQLANIVGFAKLHVPYYRDLFSTLSFNPENIRKDLTYLQDIPYLTKDIIRQQGARLYSAPLHTLRHHACRTGGSTGLSCTIYYDTTAIDYSAAVTLYARERIGKARHQTELHFACRFPEKTPHKWFDRESIKCFSMNRSNIFFDRLDDVGLEKIWQTLQHRKPHLIHAHPSTIYALACYVERRYTTGHAFNIFESSGELLENYQREKIQTILQCRVINRYGLAEFGAIAYQLFPLSNDMQFLDSEGWPEYRPIIEDGENTHELVFTGFRNKLMPLIRYTTGDLAKVSQQDNLIMTDIVGRMHDFVSINEVIYPTHHIMDILDHRVGHIQEFQIDLQGNVPILRIVPEPLANLEHIQTKINQFWGQGINLQFVNSDNFIRVGRHQKFRHVVRL
jgi:phenylacetate-CoA ligase